MRQRLTKKEREVLEKFKADRAAGAVRLTKKEREVLGKIKADWAVRFIRGGLTHTKGKWNGQPFTLLPWQEYQVVRPLFGTLREDGLRQYRMCYCEIPKKNGKSELAAAIALLLLFGDQEAGAEVYGAAASRGQATIVYRPASRMVRKNRTLRRLGNITDSTKNISVPSTDSFYQVLSADAGVHHGYDAHGVIFDELHTQKTRELWDTLTEGAGDAREQPLVVAITTAGWDRNSVCYEMHRYAEQVRDGVIEDPTFLPVIYGLEEGDDWEDEESWKKANPSLGHTIQIETLRTVFQTCG